jgi:hypothetical protein
MRMLAFSHLLCATFAVAAGAMPNVVSTAAGFATLQIHADVPWDGSLADNESRLSFTSIDEASGKSQMISCSAPQHGQVRSPQPTATGCLLEHARAVVMCAALVMIGALVWRRPKALKRDSLVCHSLLPRLLVPTRRRPIALSRISCPLL